MHTTVFYFCSFKFSCWTIKVPRNKARAHKSVEIKYNLSASPSWSKVASFGSGISPMTRGVCCQYNELVSLHNRSKQTHILFPWVLLNSSMSYTNLTVYSAMITRNQESQFTMCKTSGYLLCQYYVQQQRILSKWILPTRNNCMHMQILLYSNFYINIQLLRQKVTLGGRRRH